MLLIVSLLACCASTLATTVEFGINQDGEKYADLSVVHPLDRGGFFELNFDTEVCQGGGSTVFIEPVMNVWRLDNSHFAIGAGPGLGEEEGCMYALFASLRVGRLTTGYRYESDVDKTCDPFWKYKALYQLDDRWTVGAGYKDAGIGAQASWVIWRDFTLKGEAYEGGNYKLGVAFEIND
jgi:hypothetical protein